MKATAKAQLRHLRMSPQKVRLVAGLIRGLDVKEAEVQLTYSKKRAARPMKKLLLSAVANAMNNANIKEETLKIDQIFVNEGPILYRWMPRAMGRATPLRKRSSHITIVVAGDAQELAEKNVEKKEVAEDTATKKEHTASADAKAKKPVAKKKTTTKKETKKSE